MSTEQVLEFIVANVPVRLEILLEIARRLHLLSELISIDTIVAEGIFRNKSRIP